MKPSSICNAMLGNAEFAGLLTDRKSLMKAALELAEGNVAQAFRYLGLPEDKGASFDRHIQTESDFFLLKEDLEQAGF